MRTHRHPVHSVDACPVHTLNECPHDQTSYRWVILVLLWLLYVAFGLAMRSVAPLVTPILRDLDLSYTQMGIILGSWQLTYIPVSIIAGTIVDRWGARKSLFAGTLAVGISLALRSLPRDFGGMLGAVGLLGVGGPLVSIGCPKTISMWFQGKSRGTAIGVYLSGPWVGGVIALTLTNRFLMPVTRYSWRSVFLLYGLFACLVALLWWFFGRDHRNTLASKDTGTFKVFYKLIKVRNIVIVITLGLLAFAISHGFTNWLPKILEASGLPPENAGITASLPLIAGIPALLFIPRLVPARWRGRYLASAAFLVLVSVTLCINASGTIQLVALVFFGLLTAPFVPILTLILMDAPEVGSAYMGAAGGLFFCIGEIGGVMGPLMMGAVVDLTGSFLAGTLFFGLLCVAIIGLTLLLKTQPAPEAKGSI
jgi:cyanate permease